MSFVSRARRSLLVAAGFGVMVGCTVAPDDPGVDEGALVPKSATTLYDQALACRNSFAARAGFRDVDLAEGVLRWSCGDVNGVTAPDLGQEYCEFHAVMNGKVNDGPEIAMGPDDQVECLFTSTFSDAAVTDTLVQSEIKKHTDPATGNPDIPAVRTALGEAQALLAADIAREVGPLLKNATAIDPAAATMQVGFNSRGAARQLISDCSNLATNDALAAKGEHAVACVDVLSDATRPATHRDACKAYVDSDRSRAGVEAENVKVRNRAGLLWQQALKLGAQAPVSPPGSPPATLASTIAAREASCTAALAKVLPESKEGLTQTCTDLQKTHAEIIANNTKVTDINTRTETLWTAAATAGVAFRADDEIQRDLAACTVVGSAQGVGWRNSDPAICARSLRAAKCGLAFETLPDALTAFELRGWTNRETLPVGCRYLDVRGGTSAAPFRGVVVCTADRADVEAYSRAGKRLQAMCRDRFGVNLALQAPLRAVARRVEPAPDAPPQPQRETAAFCSAFAGPTELPLKEQPKQETEGGTQ